MEYGKNMVKYGKKYSEIIVKLYMDGENEGKIPWNMGISQAFSGDVMKYVLEISSGGCTGNNPIPLVLNPPHPIVPNRWVHPLLIHCFWIILGDASYLRMGLSTHMYHARKMIDSRIWQFLAEKMHGNLLYKRRFTRKLWDGPKL